MRAIPVVCSDFFLLLVPLMCVLAEWSSSVLMAGFLLKYIVVLWVWYLLFKFVVLSNILDLFLDRTKDNG